MAVLLGLAAFLLVGFSLRKKETAGLLRVTVDGSVFGEYDLSVDQVIPVDTPYGSNRLVIRGGSVIMEEADCPDKYCVKKGAISRTHDTLICLPHRLAAEIVPGNRDSIPEAPGEGNWEVDVYAE